MAETILPVTDGTVEHLRDYLKMLRVEREALDAKIHRVEDDILKHERRLARDANGKGKRRPRGANTATILKIFESFPTVNFTISDLGSQTGLPASSIGKSLERLVEKKRIVRDEVGWKFTK